ncbi:MAG: XrtA/PEP-CTERM system TPR-repeat protein PrsT [Thiobacillus sp.]
MTQRPVALAIALAFAATALLTACDSTAKLTEQEHIQRAKDFEDKGNLKGSILELKNAVQKNPDSPQARLLLGQVYLKSGMGAEAEKELARAVQLGVNRETIKPQLGEALLIMGEYKRILDEIQLGDSTSTAHRARILQLRADALLKQGKLKEACDTFQLSLDTDSNYPPTYWGLAQCAVAERDMVKARQWLDTAIKIADKQAKTWIFIGSLEQLNNNMQAAMAAYTNALKLDPNNLEALQSHAILSMILGQWELAKKDIDTTRKLAPKYFGTHYLQALFNFRQKKYPEARDDLNEVFKITPDHMPSVLLFGETTFALGSHQQAESYLNRYLAQFPGDAHARRVLAATQLKQNQPDRALETLAPLLRSEKIDSGALALSSEAYRIKGEPQKAAELLEKAAQLDPQNADIKTQLGRNHLAAGDTTGAINQFEAAAALDPKQTPADSLLILSLLEQKAYDKALSAIQSLEKKLPNSPVTHELRGKAYAGKNDLVNARKSFEQALAVDQNYFPAIAGLANLDLRNKDFSSARKRLEKILSQDKNNLLAMMSLAELAAVNQQAVEYVGWLEKAAKAHPKAAPPRIALAHHYMAKNDAQKALALADETLNANPNNPAALDLLASIQLATGNKTGALATYNKLVQKAEWSAEAHYGLAKALLANGELAPARAALQKALRINPTHLASQDALVGLEMGGNNPSAALHLARQMQAQHANLPLGYEREADILLTQKQTLQAIKAYELSLQKGAGSVGLIKLHQAYTLAGNTTTADQRLSDWLRQHPTDTAVRTYAAEHFMRSNRNKEAIVQFELLQRQFPNNPAIFNNLASVYQAEKNPRALVAAERALKLSPNNPAIQDTLGWILVEKGQIKRGLELLKKAAIAAPRVPTIRYHYAVALSQNGNAVQAKKELLSLLQAFPTFPEAEAAKELLARL